MCEGTNLLRSPAWCWLAPLCFSSTWLSSCAQCPLPGVTLHFVYPLTQTLSRVSGEELPPSVQHMLLIHNKTSFVLQFSLSLSVYYLFYLLSVILVLWLFSSLIFLSFSFFLSYSATCVVFTQAYQLLAVKCNNNSLGYQTFSRFFQSSVLGPVQFPASFCGIAAQHLGWKQLSKAITKAFWFRFKEV